MKQKTLLAELYVACINHDTAKIAKLRADEFKKIVKHKAKGKYFTPKWTVVNI